MGAGIMTAPNPSEVAARLTEAQALATARRVYWQYMERTAAERGHSLATGEREKCLRGDLDHQHGVQIGLAAILAVRSILEKGDVS
jgi:hypothetical protein